MQWADEVRDMKVPSSAKLFFQVYLLLQESCLTQCMYEASESARAWQRV